jgi:hypothetical protein
MKIFAAECTICRRGLFLQLGLGLVRNETLIEYQGDDDSDRESAAAESKSEYFVLLGLVVSADKFVEIEDIALESPSERTAQNGKRLEGRRADAVVVDGNLVRGGQIDRFEGPPNIGSPDLGGSVPGPVRK